MTVGRLKFYDGSGWTYAGAGVSGFSGYSGISGTNGATGTSGFSGYSGYSGPSGYSGYSGKSGYSGFSGSGISGYSGISGAGATVGIEFIIDGGGATITTGVKGDIEVPFACTITAARMFADQSGSITVSIWVDSYANFPPVIGDVHDTYVLTTTNKYQETGLSIAIAAGEIIRYNVDSATTITRCTVSLTVTKT